MSSILKALKKAEGGQEEYKPKTLPSQTKATANGSQSFILKIVSTVVIIIAAAIFYRSMNTTVSTESKTAINSTAAPIQKPEAPAVEKPTPTQKTVEPSLIVEKKIRVIPNKNLIKQIAPTKSKPSEPVIAIKPAIAVKPEPIEPQSTTVKSIKTAVPTLEVNGIAYQGEHGDSIAVVNGVTVSKHSVVDGATVEEIQKDRVLFSYKGKKFDVELGKVSQ